MLFDVSFVFSIDVLSNRSLVAAQKPEWDEFVLSPSKYWQSTAICLKHKQLFPIYDFVLSPSKYWRATAISLKKKTIVKQNVSPLSLFLNKVILRLSPQFFQADTGKLTFSKYLKYLKISQNISFRMSGVS